MALLIKKKLIVNGPIGSKSVERGREMVIESEANLLFFIRVKLKCIPHRRWKHDNISVIDLSIRNVIWLAR